MAIRTTRTTRVTGVGFDAIAPPVRWEPCSEYHDDLPSVTGVCAGCGWPADDHELPAAA